jgi:PTS system mannitol-specific IIA component/phosphocarrier protein FPr
MPGTGLLDRDGIRLGLSALDRWDAVDQVAMALLDIGATSARYGADMRGRELWGSTYVGSGIALPHGGPASTAHVHRPAMVLLQFPDGVCWAGQEVRLCVGIAVSHGADAGLLCWLGQAMLDPEIMARLHGSTDAGQVLNLLHANA